MRLRLLALLLFVLIGEVQSQDKKSALEKLQQAYRESVVWENPGELAYFESEAVIQIKTFRIPVSGSTQLSLDRKGNKVVFALQNNTVIADLGDPGFKRAYFELPFKTKDGCLSFIKYFNQLSKGG
jgi:YbbR domain-containing protein